MTFKRAFDVTVSVLAMIVLAPVYAVTAFAVRASVGSPVLFSQKRAGLNGGAFTLYKFRSMSEERDDKGQLLPDRIRLTASGRFLRGTSMDELPELLNVLKGDMSLVGPRPLLMQYLERYSPEQARRHTVKPGITGWALINGRNAITWEEKFKLDVWYVEHQSFWLDIKIILVSIWKILRRDGVSAPNHATMPEFLGDEKMRR